LDYHLLSTDQQHTEQVVVVAQCLMVVVPLALVVMVVEVLVLVLQVLMESVEQ
jgi:hypothetical protein